MTKDDKLTLIGYWLGPWSPGWPDVRRSVDSAWDGAERAAIIDYLRSGQLFQAYLGLSMCRFCAGPNGSGEQSDGTYCWPEGLAHYLEEHQVTLPRRFIDHALLRLPPLIETHDLERAEVEQTWWKGRTWQKGGAEQYYWSDCVEMLRQEYVYGLIFLRESPDSMKAWLVEKLGDVGESLWEAVVRAQRAHERAYGPHIEPVPERDVQPSTVIRRRQG